MLQKQAEKCKDLFQRKMKTKLSMPPFWSKMYKYYASEIKKKSPDKLQSFLPLIRLLISLL